MFTIIGYHNRSVFVQLKCGNDHIKQPKLFSSDAFSEIEVYQNVFSGGALPRTPLEKLHVYRPTNSEQCRAKS